MQVLKTTKDLERIDRSRSLALVPTMGALHRGHLSLVELAKKHASQVCVSIFVNPLQFAPNEDFSKYPRTLEDDIKLLEKLNIDFVFAPGVEDVYPTAIASQAITADPELSNCLCGLSRPGHFDGVCTVVKRLFDLVKPDCAVFGEKDFQQLLIIEEMLVRFKIPIKIIRAPIMREASGLAMSSRNQYLSEEEKEKASVIYKALQDLSVEAISFAKAGELLAKQGINLEYLEKRWNRIFFAGRLGSTRLIDNLATSL